MVQWREDSSASAMGYSMNPEIQGSSSNKSTNFIPLCLKHHEFRTGKLWEDTYMIQTKHMVLSQSLNLPTEHTDLKQALILFTGGNATHYTMEL